MLTPGPCVFFRLRAARRFPLLAVPEMANLSRAGKAPGSLGLSGTAGLQLKAPAKKYGLQKARPTASAFGRLEDDGEEDESVGQAAMRVGEGLRARAAATHRAAEAEDASVFDYDGVYDEMSRAKERQREALAASRGMGGDGAARPGARYISSIMEAHKAREIENDKAFERKMVKEAEEEAHLYGDKAHASTPAPHRRPRPPPRAVAPQVASPPAA